MNFSRIIKKNDKKINYLKETYELPEFKINKFNNCHWGTLKLFYSECEFLVLINKYVDINECLIVYIGAAPGYRLKNLFIKFFFPNIKLLLYDPRPFDIKSDDNIIIKTGKDGFFSDDKIDEVNEIANGRKIIYISDIRVREYAFEATQIYTDLLDQQRWGILMNADFMLLKFRALFYKNDINEINFIDNNYINKFKNKIVFNNNPNKFKDKNKWMLYLAGKIYTQIYSPTMSSETRLLVKKIKYYKNYKLKYNSDDMEKYKFKFYNNLDIEGKMIYFNLYTRNYDFVYKNSNLLATYLPGQKISYTSASEYYIIRKYLKYAKKKPNFINIISHIMIIYMILGKKYNNNLIICQSKNYQDIKSDYQNIYNQFKNDLPNLIKLYNNQFENLKELQIDKKLLYGFIKSYNTYNNLSIFKINNSFVSYNKKYSQNDKDKISIDAFN